MYKLQGQAKAYPTSGRPAILWDKLQLVQASGARSSGFANPMKFIAGAIFRCYAIARVNQSVYRKLLAQVTLADGAHGEIAVQAPFTGGLTTIPAGTEADVERAVALARSAQPAWAARSFSHRAAIFLRFHDLLLDRQDEILNLIQLETGKARRHAN